MKITTVSERRERKCDDDEILYELYSKLTGNHKIINPPTETTRAYLKPEEWERRNDHQRWVVLGMNGRTQETRVCKGGRSFERKT